MATERTSTELSEEPSEGFVAGLLRRPGAKGDRSGLQGSWRCACCVFRAPREAPQRGADEAPVLRVLREIPLGLACALIPLLPFLGF
jgi:hypothetical protein